MRAVKGYVALAIVLLIPTMGYFQKQHFVNVLQPKLRAAALELLEAEGVEEPSVTMRFLDAELRGRVASEDERAAVAGAVDALAGVRVTPESNHLRTYGWIRVARRDGGMFGEGALPPGFTLALPDSLEAAPGWDEAVERSETVEVPRGTERLEEFLRSYFAETGKRSVELRQGALTMRGDATVGLRSDWLSRASEVVQKDEVVADFTLHPSRYHLPGYEPVSVLDEERLAELRRQLAANVIEFGSAAETELPEAERDKATALARAILQAGGSGRYVVGGHPSAEGNATANDQQARSRAGVVVKLLIESGVEDGRLEAVSFGVTPDGSRANEVEVVVK